MHRSPSVQCGQCPARPGRTQFDTSARIYAGVIQPTEASVRQEDVGRGAFLAHGGIGAHGDGVAALPGDAFKHIGDCVQ